MILGLTLLLSTAHYFIRNYTAAELSAAETKSLLEQGGVLLFDTRPAEKFAEGTIPGAVNFPVDSTLESRETLLADVPRQTPIILFCKSNRCPYADDIARFLRHNGFENVAIYREGVAGWE